VVICVEELTKKARWTSVLAEVGCGAGWAVADWSFMTLRRGLSSHALTSPTTALYAALFSHCLYSSIFAKGRDKSNTSCDFAFLAHFSYSGKSRHHLVANAIRILCTRCIERSHYRSCSSVCCLSVCLSRQDF